MLIKLIPIILCMTVLTGCGSYKGNEMWRRSTCRDIIDIDEQAQCLEQATKTENEYKHEVEKTKKK